MVASCSCELLSEGVHRTPERSCGSAAAELYSAPSVRCRELPFTQHPSHVPLERFLQSPEAQGKSPTTGKGNSSSAGREWCLQHEDSGFSSRDHPYVNCCFGSRGKPDASQGKARRVTGESQTRHRGKPDASQGKARRVTGEGQTRHRGRPDASQGKARRVTGEGQTRHRDYEAEASI
uniref:Uncharacterized protein n=1 Tax=Hucho hucho TaxID=62062 RepID=A0A4W5L797_9TELE